MSVARVRIVGRAAAERSAIARALHDAGLHVEELARASDLTLHLLRSTDIVIALDQHAYLTRLLRDAQPDGVAPLLLPIITHSADSVHAASADMPTPEAAPAPNRVLASRAEDAPETPLATSAEDATSKAEALRIGTSPKTQPGGLPSALRSWMEDAQALVTPLEDESPARVRARYDALAEHVRALAHLTDSAAERSGGSASLDAADGARIIAVQHQYDVMPEHDPRNQDPGPLPELDTPASTRWVAVFMGVVALVAAAYLIFAPPTEREREEERLRQETSAESAGTARAAHVVYRARAVAARSPLELKSEPAKCRRLLQEGRLDLARKVCGRAYEHDASSATPLARVLMQSHAANDALELLQTHVQQRPEDLDAWTLLATAARNTGREDIEAIALQQLIEIHRHRDPITPLQERLQTLQADDDAPAAKPPPENAP